MTALATVVGHGLLRLPTHQAAYLGTGAVSRLEQALTNLLTNAAKYAPPGTPGGRGTRIPGTFMVAVYGPK